MRFGIDRKPLAEKSLAISELESKLDIPKSRNAVPSSQQLQYKDGIQMGNTMHQYALFGTAQFKYDQTIAHTSDPHRQIVICNNGSDVRYATLEEWEEAGVLFDERARIEGIVTSASPARDKLELFRSLFTCRKDVYAHGYRRKDGGIGYTPACANEWKPGICPKAAHQRVKCAECGNRIFPELSDAVIIAHFKGNDDRFRDVLGQYVLDRDCNTKVLVIDFDKADWKEATNAVRLVAKRRDINAAVERSRSGNGAHIWFFFLEPISAKAAREFGSCLITEAAALNKTITFEAFDRMLPAQVTIPDGGFGNLIALPFQGKAQREGNSVFVDEQFEPFPDQWLYLSQIQLIPHSTVHNLIEATGNNPHGLATVAVANKTKRYAQKPRKRLPLTSRDFPSSLPVTQADMLYIPEKSLSPAAQMEIRGLATFANPEFYRAQSMHQSVFGKPRLIDLSELRDGYVAIPRGCKTQLEQLLQETGVTVRYSDERKSDNQIVMTFKGALRPEQQIAADQMLIYEDGIMSAPTGFGKTVIGAYLIAAIGLPTLVIVPKTALITQWKSQLERFVDITDNREPVRTPKGRISKKQPPLIGQIGGGKTAVSGLIDVASFQSLSGKDRQTGEPIVKDLVRNYGLIICDECHHAAAPQLELVLKSAPAKYVYGLSATPERSDGLTRALSMLCGPLRYVIDPKTQAIQQGIQRIVRPRFTGIRLPAYEPGASFNQILDLLCAHTARNELIVDDALEAASSGRHPLVLSKRKKHAEELCRLFRDRGHEPILLTGEIYAKERKAILSKLPGFEHEHRIIVATESLLSEGFDLAYLDNLFIATPIAWDGSVTQQAGRLHRNYDGKQRVEIFDYVDLSIPMLARMYQKRLKTYAKLGYEVYAAEDASQAEANILIDPSHFLEALNKDIVNAMKNVFIAAPYASSACLTKLKDSLTSSMARGISIEIIIASYPHDDVKAAFAEMDIDYSVKTEGRLCAAVIDEETVWYGTIPLLAFPKKEDCSIRFKSSEVAVELLDEIQRRREPKAAATGGTPPSLAVE